MEESNLEDHCCHQKVINQITSPLGTAALEGEADETYFYIVHL